ncbi:iron complex transport system permease protein [Paenibacillus phyllosphaerae]|uniref:Iron complex transport system permease protein n=1 Tax=Paenibacillus phyllosphaerae TaxID=274593 RepID=A0A7W5FR34_9BACL|nr:iron ABC transporter permease [Paenibacillus phyllosphaerae]MBB3113938.1 iron complex transport system permease protein [Paenibacillus phyllosphaerae]
MTRNSIPLTAKFCISCLLFLCTFFVSMVLGAAETTVQEVWLSVFSSIKTDSMTMLREIRFPRGLAAIFVGAGLGVAGAIMQGLTRNPLADPGLLGLTAGANTALALTIALFPATNYFGLMMACFIGAAIGAIMVLGIGAMKKGGFSPLRLVLAGTAVSAFLYAVTEGVGLYFKISKQVSMWTAGGLVGTTWGQVQVIAPVIVISIFISFLLSRQLTILSINEELAIGLGQKIVQIKYVLFILIILLTGASVALVGSMAFIGLMIPHMVRAIVGTDYRSVLPMSAIIGAAFLLAADTLGRTIHAPTEMPVVAIVSVVGLPFFLFIVLKGGSSLS